eukprot:TRINITY_DN7434_c0_g1_i1.p1 TRINITY_DN7434_c0_g1~~TRINITY_DN7434_c0_g1_i1.p1  ORF type:complete len:744 (+),score=262.89 TRINITY_DN7434_c0_g1_i1:62-2293(+)
MPEKESEGRNVRSWHWEERDITRQAKSRLDRLCKDLILVDDQECTIKIDKMQLMQGDATSFNRRGRVGVVWDMNVVLDWTATKKDAATVAMEQVKGMMGGLGGADLGAMSKELGASKKEAISGTLGLQGFDQDNVDDLTIEVKVNPGTDRTELAEQLHRRTVTEGKAKLRNLLRDWGKRLKEDFDPHVHEKYALLKPGQKVDVTRDGGVRKECIQSGEGDERPTPGSKVKVHYVGTLHDTGKQFDSSREAQDGQPVVFEICRGKVIKGWDEGIVTMRKGERSKLIIRSDYAYGDQGAGDKIPGKATLCFDVEVIDWEVLRTDVSKPNDGGVMKHITTEGKFSMQPPQYEGTVEVDLAVTKGQLAGGFLAAPVEGKTFVLGDEELPVGLEMCLESMMEGEECEVSVAHRHLGAFAHPSSDGEVCFKVKMIDFDNPAPANILDAPALLQAATKRKEEGTTLYKKKLLHRAKRKWKKAVEMIEAGKEKGTQADRAKLAKLKLPCLTNLAAVQLMHKEYRDCISSCDQALELDGRNVKAVLRRAKAYEGCGENEEARHDLNWIIDDLDPGNDEAKQERAKLDRKEGQTKQQEKKTFGGMFDKMASKREEAAAKKKEELREVKAREAAEKYRAHVAALRDAGRLPPTISVTVPQGADSVCGTYVFDESGPGYKGQPVWRSGERHLYFCSMGWWNVAENESKMQQEVGALQSAPCTSKMPHEVKSWMRSVPGVGWETDAAISIAPGGAQ